MGMLSPMSEDFPLTPTDVAEALGCSVDWVMILITEGRLPARQSRGWKVAHRDLARFIAEQQSTAIALGAIPTLTASFEASRPLDDNVVEN